MSERHQAKKSRCGGKVKYQGWKEAERTAKACAIRTGRDIRPYICPRCGFIHLTSHGKECADGG